MLFIYYKHRVIFIKNLKMLKEKKKNTNLESLRNVDVVVVIFPNIKKLTVTHK